jgi:anaerobic selenocysteine-containing dehydrogenase
MKRIGKIDTDQDEDLGLIVNQRSIIFWGSNSMNSGSGITEKRADEQINGAEKYEIVTDPSSDTRTFVSADLTGDGIPEFILADPTPGSYGFRIFLQ